MRRAGIIYFMPFLRGAFRVYAQTAGFPRRKSMKAKMAALIEAVEYNMVGYERISSNSSSR